MHGCPFAPMLPSPHLQTKGASSRPSHPPSGCRAVSTGRPSAIVESDPWRTDLRPRERRVEKSRSFRRCPSGCRQRKATVDEGASSVSSTLKVVLAVRRDSPGSPPASQSTKFPSPTSQPPSRVPYSVQFLVRGTARNNEDGMSVPTILALQRWRVRRTSGVPHSVKVRSPTSFANPKSAMLIGRERGRSQQGWPAAHSRDMCAYRRYPSLSKRRFSGLRSR